LLHLGYISGPAADTVTLTERAGSKYERNLPCPILDRECLSSFGSTMLTVGSPTEDDLVDASGISGIGHVEATCTYYQYCTMQ
jgi:hypothetical protein